MHYLYLWYALGIRNSFKRIRWGRKIQKNKQSDFTFRWHKQMKEKCQEITVSKLVRMNLCVCNSRSFFLLLLLFFIWNDERKLYKCKSLFIAGAKCATAFFQNEIQKSQQNSTSAGGCLCIVFYRFVCPLEFLMFLSTVIKMGEEAEKPQKYHIRYVCYFTNVEVCFLLCCCKNMQLAFTRSMVNVA